MDEYDVFMDEKHRHISDGMLMQQALADDSGELFQYIFITPHSIAHVRKLPATRGKDDKISVMRMKPPERGQQTLTQYM